MDNIMKLINNVVQRGYENVNYNPLEKFVAPVVDRYIVNQSGEFFPEAVWKKSRDEQNSIWEDFFKDAVFGATSAPISRSGVYQALKSAKTGVGDVQPKGVGG